MQYCFSLSAAQLKQVMHSVLHRDYAFQAKSSTMMIEIMSHKYILVHILLLNVQDLHFLSLHTKHSNTYATL